jgi:hypothetical protein
MSRVRQGAQQHGRAVTILIIASIMIIIAAALFFVATWIFKRQLAREETNMLARAMPAQEFLAGPLNEVRTIMPSDEGPPRRGSNASSLSLSAAYNDSGDSVNTWPWRAEVEQPLHALDALTSTSASAEAVIPGGNSSI